MVEDVLGKGLQGVVTVVEYPVSPRRGLVDVHAVE